MKKRWFQVGVMLLLSLLVVSCGVSQDYHDSVVDERNTLQVQVTSLQKDLDKAKSDLGAAQGQIKTLQGDYETASAELAEIKKIYPPREFSSKTELRNWIFENDVSDRPDTLYASDWYSYALDVQDDALEDGYIVSAWIDWYLDDDDFYVLCSAVVEGNVYMWDPETDELIDFSYESDLSSVR